MAASGDLAAGIGDAERARVADNRNPRLSGERCGELHSPARLIVHVVADRRGANVEVVQQLLCLKRILAGDLVDKDRSTRNARSVTSSRFPIGVATKYRPGARGFSSCT